MINVTSLFKSLASGNVREVEFSALIDSTAHTPADIVSAKIIRSIGEGGLQIGNTISDRLQLSIYGSGTVSSNSKVILYLKFISYAGNSETIQIGEFTVTESSVENGVISIEAFDKMYDLDKRCTFQGNSNIGLPALSFPATMQQMLDYICTLRGITCNFTCQPFVVQTTPIYDDTARGDYKYYTQREIIGHIASAHGANARFDATGELKFASVGTSIETINANEECSSEIIDKFNPFEVKGIRFVVNNDEIFINDTGAVYSDDLEGIVQTANPFASIQVAEYVWDRLGGFVYYDCNIERRGRGYIETGDVLTVTDNGTNYKIVAQNIEYEISATSGFNEKIISTAETEVQSSNRTASENETGSAGVVIVRAGIQNVVAGEKIEIDKSNPKKPIISTTATGKAGTGYLSEIHNDLVNNVASGDFSFTAGQNNEASGIGATSLGGNNNSGGNYSTTIGNGNTASGYASLAGGNLSRATKTAATALGTNCEASGDYSVSLGHNNVSSSDSAFTGGYGNTASGNKSVALGGGNNAPGDYSVSLGQNNTSTGEGSFTAGSDNKALEAYASALGIACEAKANALAAGSYNKAYGASAAALCSSTQANGNASFSAGLSTVSDGTGAAALGISSQAGGDASLAAGLMTKTTQTAQAAVGRYNDTTDTTAIFMVGNGTSGTARSNAFEVAGDGICKAGATPEAGDNSKNISTTEFVTTAISGKEDTANKGAANGYCGLDENVRVPLQNLPSTVATTIYVDDRISTVNADISDLAGYVGFTEDDIYGVEVDFVNKIFTRLAGAAEKTGGADFDSIDAFGGRKRCNLSDTGVVNAYYGESGYIEDGSNGQVMVEQPKFYYKIVPLKMEKNDAAEISVVKFTAGASTSGNITVTLNGIAFTVEVTSGDTATGIATKVRAATFTGWTTGGIGANVIFTATKAGTKSATTFSSGATGANATVTRTQAGYIGKGFKLRKARYYISTTKKLGFKIHPAFVKNGVEKEKIYLSAYEASLYDVSAFIYILNDAQIADFTVTTGDKLSSRANSKPISGWTQDLTRRKCGILAENRGAGWTQPYAATAACSQLLFTIEYASMNSQSEIGLGVVNKTDGATNLSETTGATASLGNISGMASGTNGLVSVSYRGEENLWGNIWSFVDGMNVYCDIANGVHELYISDNTFAENTQTSPYINAGITLPTTSGYISAMAYNESFDWLFVPAETLGDSNLPVGDSFSQAATSNGYKIALLGGRWTNSYAAGIVSWSSANVPADRYHVIGGRLVYVPTI